MSDPIYIKIACQFCHISKEGDSDSLNLQWMHTERERERERDSLLAETGDCIFILKDHIIAKDRYTHCPGQMQHTSYVVVKNGSLSLYSWPGTTNTTAYSYKQPHFSCLSFSWVSRQTPINAGFEVLNPRFQHQPFVFTNEVTKLADTNTLLYK